MYRVSSRIDGESPGEIYHRRLENISAISLFTLRNVVKVRKIRNSQSLQLFLYKIPIYWKTREVPNNFEAFGVRLYII